MELKGTEKDQWESGEWVCLLWSSVEEESMSEQEKLRVYLVIMIVIMIKFK